MFIFGGKLPAHALRSFILPLLLTAGALGQAPGNRTYVGQDIYVASGQQIHNATCLFCSVQVEGDMTGHVFVLFGSVNVSGQVQRSALVIWGNAVVDSQARIGGDTVVCGVTPCMRRTNRSPAVHMCWADTCRMSRRPAQRVAVPTASP